MKKAIILIAFSFIFITGFIAQTRAQDESLLIVGAAASFNPVLTELERAFEQRYPNVDLRFHTGGSGMIARQVEAHAPIDVVMLASKKEADSLQKQRLIDMEYPTGFLTNRLVVVQPVQEKKIWMDAETLVMGTPGAVPVGTYAEQALRESNWTGTRVYAKDASSVLMWVSSGEADAGILYETDAKSSEEIRISYVFPEHSHDEIVYNAGTVVQSNHSTAKTFEAFLTSETAIRLFKQYGFDAGGESFK
ncbi:molybdate ABC transporter substrate-binding protein [Domibacillus epiphyticus]|uniref:Molybdate ABC transporter substrate-binding protein n=1 Tax=Domibacillus epiphyticus TaxID=1714355 RepID=A0A1V2A420_9BACI|nr:molybdate ABC transporter substrate-binding protein [Domibacillus epiphyticus]OMP65755.1 molybdate ABC transporter substrate-binding protein [Domibacillus epiphyticus]